MISRRTIISGSSGPIFAIFSPNESALVADIRSGPLFPISQGTLPWQPILWKNGKLRTFGEKIAKIYPAEPEIIVLRAIIKKDKKKEINAAKYIALPASLLSGLKYMQKV